LSQNQSRLSADCSNDRPISGYSDIGGLKTDLEAHDKENEFYSSDQRIDTCVSIIITVVGLGMLIALLWILKFTPDAVKSLAIITTFIVLFLVLVSYVTVSKAFEALGATAA
jgi:hypothetical protein